MKLRSLFLTCAAASLMIVAACGGDGASGPSGGAAPQFGLLASENPLLSCSELPYAADSALIGNGGGSLEAGPHKLVIPNGALKQKTWIKMEIVSGQHAGVRLSPHGLRFEVPAKLKLDYRNCQSDLSTKAVYYTDDAYNILEMMSSVDEPTKGKVTAYLPHFSLYLVGQLLSKYAVAY